MSKKKQTKKWLKGHLKDKYVKLSVKEKLKSRASYKIKQINDRYHIIKRADVVIDLGAAPGGWSQAARTIVKEEGLVIAVDTLPVTLAGVEFIHGDVFCDDTLDKITDAMRRLGAKKADALISDMAPNLTGIASTDSARSYELAKRALTLAEYFLKDKGNFVVKLFRNEHFDAYIKEVKANFSSCSLFKPEASRSKSAEIYLVAKSLKTGFKGSR